MKKNNIFLTSNENLSSICNLEKKSAMMDKRKRCVEKKTKTETKEWKRERE
jgi:hypothetical protein